MRPLDWWRRLCRAHRSDDETAQGEVREFLLPRPTRVFFIRATAVALLALAVFGLLLTPCVIDGASMIPTYPEHGFNFCWRGRYWFSEPRRGDVVILRFHDRVYYLKRVVAVAGDKVAFRKGVKAPKDIRQHHTKGFAAAHRAVANNRVARIIGRTLVPPAQHAQLFF